MQTQFWAGCRRLLPLSCLLILHLTPLFVHGDTVGTNTTEYDNTPNVTLSVSNEGVASQEAVARGNGVVDVTVVSGLANPVDTVTQRAGRIPRAGEQDGSGMLGGEAVLPIGEVSVSAPPEISFDSAETEHLLPSNTQGQETVEDSEEEDEDGRNTELPWLNAKDLDRVLDLDRLATTPTTPPPANPSHPDILTVDFFDHASRGRALDLAPPSPSSSAHELQGRDPTSWAMPDTYDYLTPYDDGVSPTADEYSYGTTTDTYEADDDLRLTAGSPSRPRPRAPAGAPPESPAVPTVGGSDGSGGCRPGYVRQNGSCSSPCNLPGASYCFNGGQCYLLEGMGVFCRCNVQDYIWHKGARCESVVTEFQVMCLAIGAAALMVLLLFMIVVCFAKKLHVLKTENNKLRRRSKYRPGSEAHNDNFSLSTIAEGSHPNKTMSRYTWECKTKEETDCEFHADGRKDANYPVTMEVTYPHVLPEVTI